MSEIKKDDFEKCMQYLLSEEESNVELGYTMFLSLFGISRKEASILKKTRELNEHTFWNIRTNEKISCLGYTKQVETTIESDSFYFSDLIRLITNEEV